MGKKENSGIEIKIKAREVSLSRWWKERRYIIVKEEGK